MALLVVLRRLTVRRRAALVIVAAAVLAAAVALVVYIRSGRDDGTAVTSVYAPQPERRYLTIGTNDDRQFSDEELSTLAQDYSMVVFAKFHGGWDVELHHEATRRLAALDPDIGVYAYMSTKYWFNANRWGVDIDPDWLLRDEEGELIAVTQAANNPDSKERGYYVDVTNPDYRAWLLEVAKGWLAAAPYAGIRFDAADPIGDFGKHNIAFWSDRLSPERLRAYNEGIETLLSSLREELAPRQVLFNGISPSPIRGEDRGLSMLAFTDGAMDELFCGAEGDVVPDLEIMSQYADKSLQMHMPADPDDLDPDTLRQREGYCVGSFLLGWQPGSTRFSMGKGYSVDQLDEQPKDIDLDLGAPEGMYRRSGDLLQRSFADGIVYVNVGDDPVDVDVPPGHTRVEAGRAYRSDDETFTLEARSGAFFLTDQALFGGTSSPDVQPRRTDAPPTTAPRSGRIEAHGTIRHRGRRR